MSSSNSPLLVLLPTVYLPCDRFEQRCMFFLFVIAVTANQKINRALLFSLHTMTQQWKRSRRRHEMSDGRSTPLRLDCCGARKFLPGCATLVNEHRSLPLFSEVDRAGCHAVREEDEHGPPRAAVVARVPGPRRPEQVLPAALRPQEGGHPDAHQVTTPFPTNCIIFRPSGAVTAPVPSFLPSAQSIQIRL